MERAIRLTILLVVLAACAQARGQVDTVTLAFRQLGIHNGLSQGMVNAIVQDRYGFMWFATKDGLDRYDGYTFKSYRHDPLDSNSLRDSHVLALLEDRKGRLWVGTNKGLDHFDPATEVFHHVPCANGGESAEGMLPDCAINEILEDPLGTLWVATEHALARITPADTVKGSRMIIETIINERISGLTIDAHGILRASRRQGEGCTTLIIDTRDPVHRGAVVHATGTFFGADPTSDPAATWCLTMCADTLRNHTYAAHSAGLLELVDTRGATRSLTKGLMNWGGPACAEVDASGRIWFSTMGKVFRVDPSTGHSSCILPLDQEQLIEMANVHCMYRDRGGVFWLGTKGHGVLSYDPRVERFHPQRSATMRWMLPRNDGRVVMVRGRWAYAYDPVAQQDEPAFSTTTAAFLNDQKGREPSLVQDGSGAVWMNDHGALVRYEMKDGSTQRFTPLSSYAEFPIHLHGDSVITFASDQALGSFDLRTQNFRTYPYPIPAVGGVYLFLQAIHHDPQGIIWLGTMKGLLRLDPRTQEWKHFVGVIGDTTSLSSDVVFSLLDDPSDPLNFLWVGTNGGGLHRLDKRTGTFTHFGTEDGLPNEVIYGLLADEDGDLWMSTNKGIARLDPRTGEVRCFDAGDGLQGDEFNRYSFCKQRDGTMFFGGVDGFCHFHPRDLKNDERPVQMSITDIKWMNRSVPFGKDGAPLSQPARIAREVVISSNTGGMLTIEFASMDLGATDNRRYQYQLEGYDPERIHAGVGRSATYTNLDPGEYTFKVWGSNRDGVWNQEPLSLQVMLLPPWYLTTWAKVLSALLVIVVLIVLHRLRVRVLRRRWERERASAASAI